MLTLIVKVDQLVGNQATNWIVVRLDCEHVIEVKGAIQFVALETHLQVGMKWSDFSRFPALVCAWIYSSVVYVEYSSSIIIWYVFLFLLCDGVSKDYVVYCDN